MNISIIPCHARRTTLPVLVVAALLAAQGNASAEEGPNADDWEILTDTTLIGALKKVDGDVIVRSGATLTVLGAELLTGGKLLVEAGATLEIHPWDGRAARLRPSNESAGFHVDVRGRLATSGTPRTNITGLNGDGLVAVFSGKGGIQIWGDAQLEDIAIVDSTAGVMVGPGANALIRNASLARLGPLGVTSHGKVRLENAWVSGSGMGVLGRETCDIIVESSHIEGTTDSVFVNSCSAKIRNSTLGPAAVPVTAKAAAYVEIENSRLESYSIDGLSATSTEDRQPRVHLTNVTFAPLPEAVRAMELISAREVTLDQVTIPGHQHSGIEASSSKLTAQRSTIIENKQFGIYARAGDVQLVGDENYFGTSASGDRNLGGALVHNARLRAVALSHDQRFLPGLTIEIHSNSSRKDRADLLLTSATSTGGGLVTFEFPTHTQGPDGNPEYLGPFYYLARHPDLGSKILRADVPNLFDIVVVEVPEPEENVWKAGLVTTLAVAGLAVVGLVFLPGRAMRSMARFVLRRPRKDR